MNSVGTWQSILDRIFEKSKTPTKLSGVISLRIAGNRFDITTTVSDGNPQYVLLWPAEVEVGSLVHEVHVPSNRALFIQNYLQDGCAMSFLPGTYEGSLQIEVTGSNAFVLTKLEQSVWGLAVPRSDAPIYLGW